MARRERRSARGERIRALLEAGDHAAARAEALSVLGDAAAPDDERAEARAALASLAPDRGAVVAGALGVAVAIAIALAVLAGVAR